MSISQHIGIRFDSLKKVRTGRVRYELRSNAPKKGGYANANKNLWWGTPNITNILIKALQYGKHIANSNLAPSYQKLVFV